MEVMYFILKASKPSEELTLPTNTSNSLTINNAMSGISSNITIMQIYSINLT